MLSGQLDAVTGRDRVLGGPFFDTSTEAPRTIFASCCGPVLVPGKWAQVPVMDAVRTTRNATTIENGPVIGSRFLGSKSGPRKR